MQNPKIKLTAAHNDVISLSKLIKPECLNDPDTAQEFLDRYFFLNATFTNSLALLDKEGVLVATTPMKLEHRGLNYSFREYFSTTMATGKPYISNPYLSSRHQHPVIMLMAPVYDSQGEVIGVFGGSIDLLTDNVLSRLLNIKSGNTGYFYLATHDRELVLHPDQRRLMERAPSRGLNQLFEQAVKGFEGSGQTVTSRGIATITSIKQLRTKNWFVGANYPQAEAYAPIYHARRTLAYLMVGIVILLSVIVWWWMNSLTRPLLNFTRHVEGISEKKGTQRFMPAASADEIGRLTEAFNRMVGELDAQQGALLESELKYRRIVDTCNEGIWLVGSDSRITFVNARIAKMLGCPDEDIVGQNPADLVFEEDKADHLIRGENRRKGLAEQYERRWRRKDGTVLWTIVSATPLFDAQHNFSGSFAMITDITERKQAEEERRGLEERLQRAEKMEALGTLAGGVAHDLNNVLGIVVGYSEMLTRDPGQSGSAKSNAIEILKGGQRAAAIVQDLLTLARRGIQGRQALNLNSILLECQGSPQFANLLSYHPNIVSKMEFEPGLLNISGSPVHLEKSFINLVSNAVEAMPAGGTLTVKTWNRYLDKPVSGYDEVREGDYVVLSVTDTGEGIPTADLKRIFEPFYTKKVMGRSGTGLGLAVVWGTVKDHNGYINVESEEGEGTTFTLYFPVTREEITPEQIAASAAEYMGNGESILVVDDVKEQRRLAETLLEILNYSVVSVAGGEEAVEYLKHNRVDLVVLDMILNHDIDGLDTYRRILDIHPHQKAIIVSGFAETERVAKAQELGAGAYVKKPYVIEKLGVAVRRELDRQA